MGVDSVEVADSAREAVAQAAEDQVIQGGAAEDLDSVEVAEGRA